MKIKAKKCACAEAPKKVVTKKAAAPKAEKAPKAPAKQDVTFTVHAEAGKAVFVAGEFNGWDPTAKKMAYKARQGVYTATVKLAPGTYQYKYVIDGTWCADPENVNAVANDQGTFNSVITVK
jgi:1,4-alpha-glucan branching enzyme